MVISEIPGDMPEVRALLRGLATTPTLRDMDSLLKSIPTGAARRHFTRCGDFFVTSNPLALTVQPTTTLLLILDIDETLVDARAPPAIHVRPGTVELFARLAELRRDCGVEVWLWTAALDVHAARCVGVLRHAFGDLPVDAVVVRGPEWMSTTQCAKDTRRLQLAGADRVLLVDNTPAMVLAAPQSALVVPSYHHQDRHSVECRHPRPTLSRVADIAAALAASPTARVADFLARDPAMDAGVRPWDTPLGQLHLLFDLESAPPRPSRSDALAPAPLTPPPSPTLGTVAAEAARARAIPVC